LIYCIADWRYRHAGLMAISASGEGCHKEMSVVLDDLVNGILVFLKDSVILLFVSLIFILIFFV
jgi:hypothetical protein